MYTEGSPECQASGRDYGRFIFALYLADDLDHRPVTSAGRLKRIPTLLAVEVKTDPYGMAQVGRPDRRRG